MMFCLLAVNILLASLKVKIISSIIIAKSSKSCIALCNYIITIFISNTSIRTAQVLLKSDDIEINPGLKKSSEKVPLIDAFITTPTFDIACLSGTFLDSTIPHNDENININRYSLLRFDHSNNIKQGRV